MTLGAALAVLASCKFTMGEGEWHQPVGWVGVPAGCDEPSVKSNPAVGVEDGWLVGRAPGTAHVTCKGGEGLTLVVRAVARLAIDGPTRVHLGDRVYYNVHAVAADGEQLPLNDDTPLEWRTSDGSEIQPGFCSDMPVLGCPDHDSARLKADRAGTLQISVRFRGYRTTLAVRVE